MCSVCFFQFSHIEILAKFNYIYIYIYIVAFTLEKQFFSNKMPIYLSKNSKISPEKKNIGTVVGFVLRGVM